MKTFVLIFFLLFACDIIYTREASLNYKLSWYLGKTQIDLINYLGAASQQNLLQNEIEIIYLFKTQESSIRDQYRYSCSISFFINRKTKKIIKYEYRGQKCYGPGAVYINSNVK